MNKETISDILCDLYDIRNMAMLDGFGNLPKDNEGTETTIQDCLENCIQTLESEEASIDAYEITSERLKGIKRKKLKMYQKGWK